MESGTIDTTGGQIYYQSHGDGPVIVLAHGIGGNHAIWFRQIAPFAQTNRVITFDHRGFGLSRDLDKRGRAAFVDDLTALLDHLGIEKAALVGQSMGAGTCIGFALVSPERVAALAICDSLHGIVESDGVTAIMESARARTNDMGQIDRVLGERARRADPALAMLYSQIASFNSADRPTLAGAFTPRPASGLGGKRFPVLFLCGTEDIVFPVEAVRLVQAEVEGSFLVEVSDSGHSAFLEQPAQFNDTILTLMQMAGHVGKSKVAHSNAPGYAPVGDSVS